MGNYGLETCIRDLSCIATKKTDDMKRSIVTAIVGVIIGILIGITSTKYGVELRVPLVEVVGSLPAEAKHEAPKCEAPKHEAPKDEAPKHEAPKHEASKNEAPPCTGVDLLPPGIVEPTTDLFTRRLWGNPNEDIPYKTKYLVTFTVGFDQKDIVNAAVSKFSKNWTIILFHYDGRTNEWDELEWAENVIHISAKKQTKWWFAKRFLHPDIVAPFEYIFIWDEDLGVDHFDAEKYIDLVKKHGLEISQPGLEPTNRGLVWQMTKRLGNSEVHKSAEERQGWCHNPLEPPCAGFVEIMAPVFSKTAWQCVWNLIQNDLVHGWGLDFAIGRCVQPPHEKVGVVDAQYIQHKGLPSLGNQGQSVNGRPPWEGVRQRCNYEWQMFRERLKTADKDYEQGNTTNSKCKRM